LGTIPNYIVLLIGHSVKSYPHPEVHATHDFRARAKKLKYIKKEERVLPRLGATNIRLPYTSPELRISPNKIFDRSIVGLLSL
jgi:hypothetical protein